MIRTVLLYMSISWVTKPAIRQNVGVIFEPIPVPLVNGHDFTHMILAVPYSIPPRPAKSTSYADMMISYSHRSSLRGGINISSLFIKEAKALDSLINSTDHQIDNSYNTITLFLSDPINKHKERIRRDAMLEDYCLEDYLVW